MPRLRNPLKRDLRKCEEVRGLMSDYLDGELAAEGRRRVERHIFMCRPCRRVLANLRRTLGRLAHLSESPPPGADDERDVAERLRSAWRNHA
jgi:anti-sigma factor RsiW